MCGVTTTTQQYYHEWNTVDRQKSIHDANNGANNSPRLPPRQYIPWTARWCWRAWAGCPCRAPLPGTWACGCSDPGTCLGTSSSPWSPGPTAGGPPSCCARPPPGATGPGRPAPDCGGSPGLARQRRRPTSLVTMTHTCQAARFSPGILPRCTFLSRCPPILIFSRESTVFFYHSYKRFLM